MIETKDILKYLLEQVQANNFDKEYAFSILKQLKEKSTATPDEIAIIGIGCRMASTDNHYDYWDSIINHKDYIGPFPVERCNDLSGHIGLDKVTPSNFLMGAYLHSIDKFDAEYFRIPPNIAESMDPYQRLFLEVAAESFMDAGYPVHKVKGSSTGVFIGTDHTHKFRSNYLHLFPVTDFSTMTGSWSSILASRTSYTFNLSGPAMVIDTACSSSLSALSVACNSLHNGECNQALVGGVNIFFSPLKDNSVNLEVIESEDIKVRPFDRDAHGSIWGEAVCSILIKPLKQAIKDNDNIYAVIKTCGINNDGTTNGITSPNPKAQKDVIVNTWKRAKVNPENIHYIEAHAIGTILGDSMEIKALKEAFEQFTDKKQFCGIGSVKGNYGHTVGVSGLLSTIKVALALRYNTLPATINYENPNPHIDFPQTPLYPVTETKEWVKNGESKRLAAVDSYSFNGTNIHLLLEEYTPEVKTEMQTGPNIFTLSARTPELLAELIKRYVNYINRFDDLDINRLCYTQNCGRDHYTHRIAFVVNTYQELKEKINQLWYDKGVGASLVGAQNTAWLSPSGGFTTSHLQKICEYYIQGININWDNLYANNPQVKLPIPLMPFKQERYWPSKQVKSTQSLKIEGKEYDSLTPVEKDVAHVWAEVLGFGTLHINDDLYQLGADSISAMRIVNMLNEKYSISIAMSDILITPKLSDFAALLEKEYLSGEATNTNIKTPEITKASPVIKDYYTVSSPQKRMFYLWHLSHDSTLYNLSIGAPINREISLEKLQVAFDKLVQDNESMRTSFKSIDDTLYQVIRDKVDTTIYYEDHSEQSIDNLDYVNNLMAKSIHSYDLEKAPLFRLHLFRFKDNNSFIYLDIHHIISDGTSLGIFFQSLMNYYDGIQSPVSYVQYKDYAAWQQNMIHSELLEKQEQFWLSQFDDEIPVLNLPTDFKRPQIQSFEGDTARFVFVNSSREKAVNLAKSNHTTLNVVMLSVINILLSKLSNQQDIVVGMPISGRVNQQIDTVLGMFVNTLAIRNKLSADSSFTEFLNEVKINLFKAYDNQNYQFEDLVDKLAIKRDASRNPVFDVMFQMQNEEFTMPLFECQRNISKFDLTITVREEGDDLHMDIEYAKTLFRKETIQRFFQYINLIIDILSDNESIKLSDISLLDANEKDLILNVFNATKTDYPDHQSVISLFKEVVHQYPDKVALLSEEKQYTYQELDICSNRLANYISNYIFPGDHVNLISDRSSELIIAILAILKAGAVYVPLDTKYPAERIASLIEDSNAKLVLVQDKYNFLVNEGISKVILAKDTVYSENINDLPIFRSPLDIAYIMYTSGSTGKPKGVLVEHRNIIRLVRNTNYHNFTSADNIPLLAAPSFDANTFEVYGTLLNGGTLCIIDEKYILDPANLKVQFEKMNVNFSFFTTALFNQYSEKAIDVFSNLNTVLIGGERLSISACNRFHKTYPHIAFYNVYGPTENCTYSTYFKIDKEYTDDIPIGAPISNSTLYILDATTNLQPIGVVGEICLGGDGIAKGYLNNDELTNEKFIDNPYGAGKLYRTGDYGKWLPDGNVAFIGRVDNQLKIRGFRIELDEIEAILLKHKDIAEAAITVEVNESGLKDLSCFYKTKNNVPLSGNELRKYLSEQLPEYMIPSFYTQVEKFVLNKNGKIDKALLVRDTNQPLEDIVLPANELEATIVEVWKEVLGLNSISTDSNFFHIGGDSIKAIQISSRLQAKGIGVNVNTIFQHSSIQELAKNIELCIIEADQGVVEGEVALTPIQRWFFDLNLQNQNHFNQGVLIKMKQRVSVNDLNIVFTKLTEHHDALRMKFDTEGPVVNQYNRGINESAFDIKEFDMAAIADQDNFVHEQLSQLEKEIDITEQLVKVACFNGNEYNAIGIVIHHLVIDGISWRILLEDFFAAVEQLGNGQEIQLPNKTTSFLEWSNRLQNYAMEVDEEYVRYWNDLAMRCGAWKEPHGVGASLVGAQNTAGNNIPQTILRAPTRDAPTPCGVTSLRHSVDPVNTQLLLQETNQAYNTEINDILIAALGMSLSDWSNNPAVLINMEGHGRENILDNTDIARTIGWFTSSYPVLINMEGKKGLAEIIKHTKDYLHTIPQKGIDYGIIRYLSDRGGNLSNITPSISFNYLGQFDMNPSGQETDSNTVEFLPLGTSSENKRYFDIDINAIVSGGQLHIDFNYSREVYEVDRMHQLINIFGQNLTDIITHCKNKDDTEYTLSDYTSKDIDEEEFGNILDELGFD